MEADAATLSKVSRVGVVSVTGDKLHHYKLGFTVFGNKQEVFDISDMALDDAWEAAIIAAVGVKGGIDVVEFDYDRARLLEGYPREGAWPRQWRILDFKKIAQDIQAIARENALDAVVLLGSSGRELGRANFVAEGVSIISDGGGLAPHNAYFWLVARLYLVDGATGLPIASRDVGESDFLGLTNPLTERAPEELREKWFAEFTEEERALLREKYIALPALQWDTAVESLFEPRKER